MDWTAVFQNVNMITLSPKKFSNESVKMWFSVTFLQFQIWCTTSISEMIVTRSLFIWGLRYARPESIMKKLKYALTNCNIPSTSNESPLDSVRQLVQRLESSVSEQILILTYQRADLPLSDDHHSKVVLGRFHWPLTLGIRIHDLKLPKLEHNFDDSELIISPSKRPCTSMKISRL